MSKLRTSVGGAYAARGRIFMRVTVAAGVRRAEALTWVTAEHWAVHGRATPCACVACERARHVQELVNHLREAGQLDFVEKLVESAAGADAAKMAELGRAVDGIVAGRIVKSTATKPGALTFRVFAERWTNGELHRLYPDVVRDKRTAHTDASRLDTHVYPLIGDRELASLTIDDALEVLRKLPSELSPASRRHVAQLLTRIFALAVYPCRLLASSPLPRGFLPKLTKKKAKAALYPDEEAALLACQGVPLGNRMLYGFVAREGMRSSEALSMTWGDLDLKRGAVRLDKNKTDDPRAWALDPSTAEALRRWRKTLPASPADALVFGTLDTRGRLADAFRSHLELAGVKRAELFERSSTRRRVRFHDLRATFVTVALAAGRTEAWVTARTGHRSSGQVATYRRLAQTFTDVGAGWFASMVDAIPELAEDAAAKRGCSESERPPTSPGDSASARNDADDVANVGDLPALGSTVERRAGSSPAPCTSEELARVSSST